MPRKIVVKVGGSGSILHETLADDEFELQELIKNNPDLLPIEEFGMTGPLLVVGRETALKSGAVDLAALARSGELLLVEFKTGPQNTDFRRVLAQLLDYGSDVWSMTYDEFESTVPLRYFASKDCGDGKFRGLKTLEAAARANWPEVTDDELAAIREKLTKQLDTGAFHYVVVAQRFTSSVERTAEYLNQTMNAAKTYAVELVRFDGDGLSAYETRTILKPPLAGSTSASRFDEGRFLDSIQDLPYRSFLQELFETCRGLGLLFEWGTSGVSVRVVSPHRPEPVTILWVFPGPSGWYGLRGVNLGFGPWSVEEGTSVRQAFHEYVQTVKTIPGASPVKGKGIRDFVYQFSPTDAQAAESLVKEALATLATKLNAGS